MAATPTTVQQRAEVVAGVSQSTPLPKSDAQGAVDMKHSETTAGPSSDPVDVSTPPVFTASPVSVTPDIVPLVAPMPTSLSNASTIADSPSRSRPSSYLSTSRPAPASPSPSRPTSIHLNRTRSGSNSSNVERSRKARPRSSLGMDVTSAVAGPSEPARLKIRDYGFERADIRFTGEGPDAEGNKTSFPKVIDDDNQSSSSRGGWGGFLSGFRGFRSRRRDNEEEEEEQPVEDDVTFVDLDDDEDDLSNASSSSPPAGPDPAGWHRAMYPFDAVGEHEMGLALGEVVDVLGRGGGQGWVVAIRRGEPEVKGLVPESYLNKLGPGEEDEVWGQDSDEDEDDGLGLDTSG